MNKKRKDKKKIKLDPRVQSPYSNLTGDERLDTIADIIIDRIIEEEKLYQERLKLNPKAKRFYEK